MVMGEVWGGGAVIKDRQGASRRCTVSSHMGLIHGVCLGGQDPHFSWSPKLHKEG